MVSEEIATKIWNIDLVVKELESNPHTYETILQQECKNTTCETILRRKLSNLYKQQKILKCVIPGTRFGKVIFYTPNKKYYIVVLLERLGVEIYYFYEFEHDKENLMIRVKDCKMLKDNHWVDIGEKYLYEGKTVLFI